FVQSRRLAFSTSAAAIQPRLIRRRHADLGERLTTLARRSAGGLGQTIARARLTFDPRARSLSGASVQLLERKRGLFARLAPRLTMQPLHAELRHARSQLTPLAARLDQAALQLTGPRRRHLDQAGKLLDSLSYRNVLARGYAMVQHDAGHLVTSTTNLNPGDAIRLT